MRGSAEVDDSSLARAEEIANNLRLALPLIRPSGTFSP
ncbi:hypothetical protein X762_13115 [Mesorhizobium sp. LSHC426A00]|nr:hypothetical protein X762_13115 [Mesorhizobium sp. LSHC426A00]ESX56220.1 hypothetical protein X761_11840 [Mesorhizobium sp. LSHC424B00]ESX73066.1 hypothetical protein X758_11175 [Mesorhizobium sp. LSHC416B00]ESZ46912.1 hypothetical protein X731_15225 [Mesorhizobium sp. L2C054A000]